MPQGDFTHAEAIFVRTCIDEIFSALSKAKRAEFLGHLNDILLYIEAADKAAPS